MRDREARRGHLPDHHPHLSTATSHYPITPLSCPATSRCYLLSLDMISVCSLICVASPLNRNVTLPNHYPCAVRHSLPQTVGDMISVCSLICVCGVRWTPVSCWRFGSPLARRRGRQGRSRRTGRGRGRTQTHKLQNDFRRCWQSDHSRAMV